MEIATAPDLDFTPFTPFTPMNKERRNFTRFSLKAKASLHLGDQTIEAKLGNLSIKGAFVTVERQMQIDDVVAFTIHHTVTPHILCSLKAKVVRMTDQGIGIQFEKSLLD